MSKAADFLVEIGTEELPPKALRSLMDAFHDNLVAAVDAAQLSHGSTSAYSSPRRLAVLISELVERQDDRQSQQKGPPVKIAFDDKGNATAAAEAFAKKCGVAVGDLGRSKSDKGEWLSYESIEKGKSATEILPGLIEGALHSLPVPRRMRWGTGESEFVRPVHWIVMLHGQNEVDATVMGIRASRHSAGHRFHSPGTVTIDSPATYLDTLERDGFVIADFDRRRELVQKGVDEAAAEAGGSIIDAGDLYDEVAALVEWPVPILGSFDERFLELPREVVVSTLTGHQRYFPVVDANGELMARFVTVANIESKNPERVRDGNERVVQPRLADAAFFWSNDKQRSLESREQDLREVVYQQGLGSLYDKSRRIASVAAALAAALNHDDADTRRAALLSKCDLLSGMVGEFPELQGTMGSYFAIADGETRAVAQAIGEHYQPRFAGDSLPESLEGQLLAIADKLDTLAGVFSIGKKPGGNRDPFGLRRAALGIVRILIECGIELDLRKAIEKAVAVQPAGKVDSDTLADELYVFVSERLRRYFLDRDPGLSVETFDAVMSRKPSSLLDFDRRLAAVQTFARLEQAESLAAANKRIANILRKSEDSDSAELNKKLLEDDAEVALFNALQSAREKVAPLLAVRSYAEALNELADLRDPIDRFFDDVMVMAEDEAVRNNRLALLRELRALFLEVADISRLSIGKE